MTLKINASDFRSREYSLVIINETSGIENLDYKNYVLQEIETQGIKIEIPNTICQKGHTLGILFFLGKEPKLPKKIPANRQSKEIYFSAIGKVKNKIIYEDNDQITLVEIQFTQYDKHTWHSMVEDFKKRKEQIAGHFEKIRVKND